MNDKRILIIAGPNGAGKTTFAQEFLPGEAGCPIFVNADLIAAGLSPFTPELVAVRAGRIMLDQIHEHIRKGESFAFETTLSGRIYMQLIPRWQAQGYAVKLFFLQLPSPEMAIARVRQRVAAGGHNVPEDVIRRRFHAGLRNFNQIYKPLVDEWVLYDNSGDEPVRLDGGIQAMRNEGKKERAPARDPDLVGSEAALRRAVTRACEQARCSAGYVVVYRDGKIVEDWVG